MGLGFFGLNSETAPQYRVNLFTQIHEICFHGKGGYDWNTVYNMPRWLRLFTFNKINDYYIKEAEDAHIGGKKSNNLSILDSSGNINKENIAKLKNNSKLPKYKK